MNPKHAKHKNTGILFELLVRRIAADVLNGTADSFAISLVREHFHSKTELGKELQLYRSFFNTPKLTEAKAFNMLDFIVQKRKTLNEKLLNAQKFLLIKEIKEHCDLKQFLSCRVPSYKIYASIYRIFDSAVASPDDGFSQIHEVVSSRFVAIEHLKGTLKEEQIIKENGYIQVMREQDKEVRDLSYKFLLEKFNDRYSVFNPKQKQLLREYINKGTEPEKFRNLIAEEANWLIGKLTDSLSSIDSDVTRIKITEVITQLKNIQTKNIIQDNHVTALLIAHQIIHLLEEMG